MTAVILKQKTPRDAKYLKWIRTQACTLCSHPQVEAHHTTSGGMGLKGSDYEAIPLCHNCHMQLHSVYGKGGPWTEEQLKLIVERLIRKYEE